MPSPGSPTSASTTGLSYTNSTAGSYTLTASVGSVTTTQSPSTSATLGGSAGRVTINVYSGMSTWNTNGGGSWGTVAGVGSGAFGFNWGTNQGSPGLDPSFTSTDTATFGSALTSGTATVTLDGASPSLLTLTLNNASHSYTIAQGTGGTLTMNGGGSGAAINVAGTQRISAPLALADDTTITTTISTDSLTLSGGVSGSGSGAGATLTVGGPGTVILSGTSSYSGSTMISAGTLQIGIGGTTGTLAAGAVTDNGTLAFNRSDAQVISNNISGSGVVTQSGSGTTTLAGTNSYGGGTNVNAGTLEFPLFANQPSSGTVAVAAGATLAVGAGGPGWTSAQIDALWNGTAPPTGVSFAGGAFLGLDTTNATAGTFTYNSNITDTNSLANPLGLSKLGAGTLVLGGTNTFTGGLNINGGAVRAGSDANLGGANGSIAFNAGSLQFSSGFTVGATRAITLNAGGGTIDTTLIPSGTAAIAGNISGPGGLTLIGNGTVVLSGASSNFQGGIFNNTTSNTLTLIGASAGGSGNITYAQPSNDTNNTLNLRSDTSATFSVASVNFSTGENYTNSFSTINVGPMTSGITGKTITLNSVTSPSDQGNNSGPGFVFSSTPGSGYTLGITTLNMVPNGANNNPITANTNVAIGALNWTDQFDNGTPNLAGSAGGSVVTATNSAGAIGGLNITGGTWTFTGANSYGAGPWTNNGVQNAGTGGTQINGASTTLVINNDLALGAVPSSAVNNIGLVAGGTLRANASFTLNSKRGIGIGPVSGTSADTGTLDVASGQTLTYNGIIASSGNTGTNNLITTPSGGTLILGGPNTYNGVTTVSGGTLRAAYPTNSPTASSTGTGNVTLNGGVLSSTAGTTSYILGSVLGGTGAHTIAPGGDGTIGTLAVGGLTPNNLSTLKFDITSPSSLDQISDSGAFGYGGPSMTAATVEVPTTLTDNTYKLIGFNSTSLSAGFNPANFSLASLSGGGVPSGYRLSLTASELDLVVNTVTDQWTNNANNGVWDIGMTQNWATTAAPSTPTTYADGNSVLFNDTNLSSPQVIMIASNVAPFNVTFGNHSIDYTIGGAAIGGNTSLVVNAGGNVTLTGQNIFAGGAIITNGTLRLGASSMPTSGSVISGPVGTGTVQLGDTSGSNSAGLVWSASSSGMSLANNITVVAGSSGNTLTIGGLNTSGTTNTYTGNITLGSGTNVGQSVTLSAAAGGEVDFAGQILANGSDTSAGVTINGGVVKLTNGTSTYAGGTMVNSGTLRVTNTSGSATGSGSVTVASGAALGGFAGPAVGQINGAVTINAGGHLAPNGFTGTSSPGPVNNLTLNGGLTLSDNSFLDYILGNQSISTSSDLITIGNNQPLNLGKSVTLNVTQGAGYASSLPATYDLISYGGSTVTGDTNLQDMTNHWIVVGGGGGKVFTFQDDTINHEIELVITLGTGSSQWDFASGGSGDGNYGDSSKWQFGTFPNGTVTHPQTATFATGSTGEINLTNIPGGTIAINNISAINPLLGGIVFNNAAISYTLNGGTITLNNDNAGASINVTAGNHFITSSLVVSDTSGLTITPAGSSSLTVSGTLNYGSAVSTILNVGGAGNTTLNGAVSGGGSGVVMNGTGILTLGSANSFTGGTTVNSGTLTTTASGALAGGSLTMGNAIVNIGGSESVTTLSTTSASGSLRVAAGANLSVNAASGNVIAPITLAGSGSSFGGGTFTMAGTGTMTITAAPILNQNSNLAVSTTGTLKLNISSNPTVQTGVTATVNAGATLELAGTTSALTDPTALSSGADTNPMQRAEVQNNGTLQVDDGAVQQVGGIDGTGSVVVGSSTGASLTADHIIQGSLTISAGSTFTLAPSDMNGNPATAGGLVLAGSLTPSSSFIASSGSLLGAGTAGSTSTPSLGGANGSTVSAVPEPSAMMLLLLGVLAALPIVRRRRSRG